MNASTDPKSVKRLLPALRRLARVPNLSISRVSFDLGVELAHLETFLAHWKIARATFTVPKLDGILRQIGLDEECEDAPERPLAQPPKLAAVAPAAAPIAAASPRPTFIKYAALVRFLLDHPLASETDACRATQLNQGSWSAFKGLWIGRGALGPDTLSAWLAKHNLPRFIDGKEAIISRDAPKLAVAVEEKAVQASPPIDTISGKERRHLVASILVGLIVASPEGLRDMLVAEAYDCFGKLVQEDLKRYPQPITTKGSA